MGTRLLPMLWLIEQQTFKTAITQIPDYFARAVCVRGIPHLGGALAMASKADCRRGRSRTGWSRQADAIRVSGQENQNRPVESQTPPLGAKSASTQCSEID
jgi:hypothetical protein